MNISKKLGVGPLSVSFAAVLPLLALSSNAQANTGQPAPWLPQAETAVGWMQSSGDLIVIAGVFMIGFQLFAGRSDGMSAALIAKLVGGAIMIGAGTVGPQLFASGLVA